MSLDPDARAQVYYLAENDHEDDPAWGLSPIWTGSVRQVASWLMVQDSLDGLSVVIEDQVAIWARDLLPRLLDHL